MLKSQRMLQKKKIYIYSSNCVLQIQVPKMKAFSRIQQYFFTENVIYFKRYDFTNSDRDLNYTTYKPISAFEDFDILTIKF